MCNLNPTIICTQEHHQPVVLEVWASHIQKDVASPYSRVMTSELILATRTDLDNARSIVAKIYSDYTITAIAKDWFTGEDIYLKTPRKRRQVKSIKRSLV